MSQDARQRWQQRYDAALSAGRVRDADFTTLSGVEVDPVYGPADGRGVLAGITEQGRAVVDVATGALTGLDFGLGDLPDAELETLFEILKRVRLGAGDVADAEPADAGTS